MRQATVLLVAAAIALMSSADARSLVRSSSREYSADFTKYKVRFNKKYDSPASEGVARHAYEENMQRAAELSKLNPIATYGENVYSDVPRAAFKATHHGGNFSRMATDRKRPVDYMSVAAGSSIDWRQKGAVTPVKNQKNCGGCWSFSTTGNIEGQWFLAGNPLVSLSEEELLACDTTNGGCHGGLMDTAFEWLINTQNGTIVTEASDPFVSANGVVPSCSLQGTVPGAQIYSYHDLPQSESKMASYLYDHGPISIGVDGSSFQTYQGGIVTNCQYNGVSSLDHAVLIVGFDDTFSTPYWIIKNSWGTIWGEEGYIRVAKGSNQCGLSDAPSTSLVQPAGPTTAAPPSPPTPAPVPTPAGSSSSSGEVPPPPPPPPSPTPAGSSSSSGDVPPPPPPPGGQNFTFYLCQDPLCLNCQTYSLPQGDCVSETFNGDSFAAVCSASGNTLEVDSFVGTSTCSGKGTTQKVDAGTCYQNVDGQTYVAFACGSGVIHKRT